MQADQQTLSNQSSRAPEPRKAAVSVAIAWQSGLIEFTRPGKVPDGALVIVSGPSRRVKLAIEKRARLSYQGKPLVPGIPEEDDPMKKVEVLIRFRAEIRALLAQDEPRKEPQLITHAFPSASVLDHCVARLMQMQERHLNLAPSNNLTRLLARHAPSTPQAPHAAE